ncbi:hypothetical protein TVAG_263240 [Trichomonas vaginalis G3]|uniref:Uncharacterized protein n=1 Tax=Trichomonas vaginalis (strain ATCC PRA-98 / G3) TaxID=412133 RepID=A2FA71_TRIV3|nr:hypothetical protein TVAGG3_0390910 [Trichomonas vaginalis G3]EAX98207.1 hypothetical protein TVAG_263240 [Trichomonas vaginalis G3]KAI5533987.1 hypothetical protein TVAGG3_0390910 [Trichomonas vaginalis G3]|eukprot:XP_001311137.1 hypothetical protein [Trichomonas vaginalis G3]
MNVESLLAQATVAKDRYIEVEAKNNDYKLILDNQKVLINDFAQSMPDIDETEKKMQELDNEIASIDEQLQQSQSILIQALSANKAKKESTDVSGILSNTISTLQDTLFDLGSAATSQNEFNVPIFKLIDLEESVSKIIGSLEEANLYPESEKDHAERIKRTQLHSAKLAQFLRLLKEIYAKASAEQKE